DSSSKLSVCSARSGKSSASSASAAHARARAEAAKVRASYASQETKLKIEKARKEAQNQLETNIQKNSSMTERPFSRRKEYVSNAGSTNHDAAMHPGPLPRVVKAPSLSQEDGGEEEDHADEVVVNTSCTDVCGPGQWGRSCSKICLEKLYPKGSKDMAIKACVILRAVQCGKRTILVSSHKLLWHHRNIWQESRRIPD
ncbi:hypothetical protein QTP86_019221, partial [Hemibagrus guttatus]